MHVFCFFLVLVFYNTQTRLNSSLRNSLAIYFKEILHPSMLILLIIMIKRSQIALLKPDYAKWFLLTLFRVQISMFG